MEGSIVLGLAIIFLSVFNYATDNTLPIEDTMLKKIALRKIVGIEPDLFYHSVPVKYLPVKEFAGINRNKYNVKSVRKWPLL